MRTSIVLMGCSQPSRLAPERAPSVETGRDVSFYEPRCATPVVVDLRECGVASPTRPESM